MDSPPPSARWDISPLALSILELLNERPMHPYELAATMRSRHHDEFIRLNFGSLYHTVDSLERDGLLVPTDKEKEGGRPERTIYRLTDLGRSVLLEVVSDIISTPRREYLQFSAGLMFMHHLEPAVAAQHLQIRAQALQGVITKLTYLLDQLIASGHRRLTLIELEHKIAVLEAERAWAERIAKEITDGKLEWIAGREAGMDTGDEKLRRKHGTGAH